MKTPRIIISTLLGLAVLISATVVQAGPAPRKPSAQAGTSSAARSPARPRLTPNQKTRAEAAGLAAQYRREVNRMDARIHQTENQLALARRGEQALQERGRGNRSATVERANLESTLQDLRVEQTRVRNAHRDALQAVNRAGREQWSSARAYIDSAQQARAGRVVPRARTVRFRALPPSQANQLSASTGARFGSVKPR